MKVARASAIAHPADRAFDVPVKARPDVGAAVATCLADKSGLESPKMWVTEQIRTAAGRGAGLPDSPKPPARYPTSPKQQTRASGFPESWRGIEAALPL